MSVPLAPSHSSRRMQAEVRPKVLIAHRGASAYAPEHTLAAYELAVEQGADFVEPDLQISRDGVLICLHDLTLERTTNVEEVFPDRCRKEAGDRGATSRWYASDFTLAEIKTLDAGSWFDERHQDARIPTFSEAVELVRGRVGLYPETKAPEVYGDLGFDMERLLLRELERHSLAPASDPSTPIVIQSFSARSLEVLGRDLGSELPRVLLISEPDGILTPTGLAGVATLAAGIAPAKHLLLENRAVVEWAHEAGLVVVAWTFRSEEPGAFGNVEREMEHFLYELQIDGLFTNNPDLFPRA